MKAFSKYFFEVLVIFTGITVSFIFDEWRGSRADDQKEKEYYSLLLSDIKSDSTDLAEVFEGIRFEQPRMDSILNQSRRQFAIDMCAAFAFIKTQNLIKSFESIRQSGDLKVVQSKEVISQCNLILSKQTTLNQRIKAEGEQWHEYMSYLRKRYPDMALFCARYQTGIRKGKITDRDISDFFNDPQIILFYNNILWTSRSINGISNELKTELNKLETRLQKELR